MRREASPYEVRCVRCDVSFPVETRSCLHCGGATGPAGQIELLEAMLESSVAPTQPMPEFQPVPEFDPMAERSVRPEPIEPQTELPFEGVIVLPDDHESETSEEPSSIGRSLLRSLGGGIWVVLLIAFTLARNCGGE